MLVLSRTKRQVVVITPPGGPRIEVTVLRISGDKIKLGIDAPESVVVDRLEVHERREAAAAGEGV